MYVYSTSFSSILFYFFLYPDFPRTVVTQFRVHNYCNSPNIIILSSVSLTTYPTCGKSKAITTLLKYLPVVIFLAVIPGVFYEQMRLLLILRRLQMQLA